MQDFQLIDENKNRRPKSAGKWVVRIGDQLFLYSHWNSWTAHGPAASVARAAIHKYEALASKVDEIVLLAYDGTRHVFDTNGNHLETSNEAFRA